MNDSPIELSAAELIPMSQFLTTFPNVVDTMPGEWIVGLLLRCDEANTWSAGTAAYFISHVRAGVGTLGKPSRNIVGYHLDIQLLAASLAASPEGLESTLFRKQLERFFSTSRPNARALGIAPRFRICPQCIHENMLLQRVLVLPLVSGCQEHGTRFQDTCTCGSHLIPYRHEAKPFTCGDCGKPWGELPRVQLARETQVFDSRVYALYETLLSNETVDSLQEVRQYAYWHVNSRGWPDLPELTSGTNVPRIDVSISGAVSVSQLVVSFVGLGISPEQLHTARKPPRPHAGLHYSCPNAACSHFGLVDKGNIHVFSKLPRWIYYYCNQCASRFNEAGQLTHTFDTEHGTNDLTPDSVTKAQQLLQQWKIRLDDACIQMREEGDRITIRGALVKAGIPAHSYASAPRLGLADIARKHIIEQRNAR